MQLLLLKKLTKIIFHYLLDIGWNKKRLMNVDSDNFHEARKMIRDLDLIKKVQIPHILERIHIIWLRIYWS